MINELIEQIGGREQLEFIAENAISRERIIMARALLAVLNAQENSTIRKCKALLWLERQQVAHPGMKEVRYAIELITAPPAASVHLQITDEMALAFHQAIGDGSIGSGDVAEIKTGLASAFANVTFPTADSAPDGWLLIPAIPSQSHLNSIAMRYRHDFYLLPDNQRDIALSTARQMYEECSGQGFYSIPKPAAPSPGGKK